MSWKHDDLAGLPLVVESPPDDDRFTEIVRSVGRLAKDTSRVEVPFETVLPAAGQWWTSDSRAEIEVPLGRAGAMKLQHLRLGKGTSQHVLIAGKTGSGKSTLLNAMITNLAAHYSPAELEFYLIDFKKGVEFKAYAANRLPHARVIAIESEREFGLSVLERTREIGLLRAVGMSRSRLRRMITLESVAIAVLGAVLGMALGLVIGVLLRQALKDDLTSLGLPLAQLLVFLGVAVVVGVLAAVLPAIRASRLNVLAAIVNAVDETP